MAKDRGRPVGFEAPEMVFRAMGIGACVGPVFGAAVGSAAFPVVGTCFGAILGVPLGAVFGLANGLVLMVVDQVTASRWVASVVAALTSFGCSLGVVAASDAPWPPWGSPIYLVFVGICTILAVPLGPIAIHGARPLTVCRRFGPRPVATVVKTALVVGAVGGGASGALIGVSIGVAAYWPTAVVAMFEGGILCAVDGAVAGLLIFGILIAPRLRVRQ
jgi:hypothetical protein